MNDELTMESFIPYVEDTLGLSIGCKNRLYKYLNNFCRDKLRITKRDKEILVKSEDNILLHLYIEEERPNIAFCSEGLMSFLMY